HPMPGKQRLVRRDDMTPRLQRRLDGSVRGAILAADQFDKDVDPFRAGKLDGVVVPMRIAKIDAAILRAVARRDGGDDQITPTLARKLVGLLVQNARHGGADRAETGNPNTQCFGHEQAPPSDSSLIWAV